MTLSDKLCFVDIETTGLDVKRHAITEIALIIGNWEYNWRLELDGTELRMADPGALRMTDWYERDAQVVEWWTRGDDKGKVLCGGRGDFANMLVRVIGTRHLVGAVPNFDAEFLREFCLDRLCMPVWHYHLIDVEALAVGWLTAKGRGAEIPLPWKSDDLYRMMGINPEDYPRHTALGDAYLARDVYLMVASG